VDDAIAAVEAVLSEHQPDPFGPYSGAAKTR
jgi:hypothetical protein